MKETGNMMSFNKKKSTNQPGTLGNKISNPNQIRTTEVRFKSKSENNGKTNTDYLHYGNHLLLIYFFTFMRFLLFSIKFLKLIV